MRPAPTDDDLEEGEVVDSPRESVKDSREDSIGRRRDDREYGAYDRDVPRERGVREERSHRDFYSSDNREYMERERERERREREDREREKERERRLKEEKERERRNRERERKEKEEREKREKEDRDRREREDRERREKEDRERRERDERERREREKRERERKEREEKERREREERDRRDKEEREKKDREEKEKREKEEKDRREKEEKERKEKEEREKQRNLEKLTMKPKPLSWVAPNEKHWSVVKQKVRVYTDTLKLEEVEYVSPIRGGDWQLVRDPIIDPNCSSRLYRVDGFCPMLNEKDSGGVKDPRERPKKKPRQGDMTNDAANLPLPDFILEDSSWPPLNIVQMQEYLNLQEMAEQQQEKLRQEQLLKQQQQQQSQQQQQHNNSSHHHSHHHSHQSSSSHPDSDSPRSQSPRRKSESSSSSYRVSSSRYTGKYDPRERYVPRHPSSSNFSHSNNNNNNNNNYDYPSDGEAAMEIETDLPEKSEKDRWVDIRKSSFRTLRQQLIDALIQDIRRSVFDECLQAKMNDIMEKARIQEEKEKLRSVQVSEGSVASSASTLSTLRIPRFEHVNRRQRTSIVSSSSSSDEDGNNKKSKKSTRLDDDDDDDSSSESESDDESVSSDESTESEEEEEEEEEESGEEEEEEHKDGDDDDEHSRHGNNDVDGDVVMKDEISSKLIQKSIVENHVLEAAKKPKPAAAKPKRIYKKKILVRISSIKFDPMLLKYRKVKIKSGTETLISKPISFHFKLATNKDNNNNNSNSNANNSSSHQLRMQRDQEMAEAEARNMNGESEQGCIRCCAFNPKQRRGWGRQGRSLATQLAMDIAGPRRGIPAEVRRMVAELEGCGDFLLKRERCRRVMVGPSRIHDLGLYTLENCEAQSQVVEFTGEVVGQRVADKREAFYESRGIDSVYMFRLDAETICDATMQGNASRYINHSCESNTEARSVKVDGKRKIVFFAKRDLKAGEEITYDYKFAKESNPALWIRCLCNSKNCRVWLNG